MKAAQHLKYIILSPILVNCRHNHIVTDGKQCICLNCIHLLKHQSVLIVAGQVLFMQFLKLLERSHMCREELVRVYYRQVIYGVLIQCSLANHYIQHLIHVYRKYQFFILTYSREHFTLAAVDSFKDLIALKFFDKVLSAFIQHFLFSWGVLLADKDESDVSIWVYMDVDIQLELLSHSWEAHCLEYW